MQIINRRTAIAGIASISATGAAVAASSSSQSDAQENPVIALVEAHRRAEATCEEIWSHMADLEATIPVPLPKVKIGHYSECGTYRIGFAYTKVDLLKSCDEHRQNLIRYHSEDPYLPSMLHNLDDKQDRLLASFLMQEESRKAAEDASGLTSARESAIKAGEAADLCLNSILEHQYTSMEEVKTAAAYLLDAHAEQIEMGDADVIAKFVKKLVGRD